MKARESRHGPGQTRTEHEWSNASNSDDRDRPQMADDDDLDSQALANGDITRYRALVARISYLSQDRPDLKFASMQVCCAMAKPTMRDMERVKRIGRYLVGKLRARCWFRWQHSGELEAYSDADWGGDKATRKSVSAGIIMRGAPASRYGPRNSKLWRCLQLRASCTRLGNVVWAESAPGCLSNNVLGQPQRSGQGEARRRAESVDTGGIQIWPVHHEESRHEREPSRLDDETAGKAEDRTAHGHHGLRVHGGWG